MEELNTAMMAGTSDAVKLWMNWMMLVFGASLLFVWKFKAARFVLLAFFLTGFVGFIIWSMTKNIHLLGIAHLILWIPLALYLWKTVLSGSARAASGPSDGAYAKTFLIWVGLVFATIIVSLVFDVRDIFLVMTGGK